MGKQSRAKRSLVSYSCCFCDTNRTKAGLFRRGFVEVFEWWITFGARRVGRVCDTL